MLFGISTRYIKIFNETVAITKALFWLHVPLELNMIQILELDIIETDFLRMVYWPEKCNC